MMVWRIFILCLSIQALSVSANASEARTYNKENPLVYEDSWNLWPYSFINDRGEPDGFNVDLLRILMKELDIPYVIKLKPRQQVLEDMEARRCDLTLTMTTGSNDGGLYGRNIIIMFTQSVATPKNKPVTIKTFRDLNKNGQQVIVSDSSLCHHLMLDYGWAANAIVCSDMGKAVRQVNDKKEGRIVWNTLSLKWLISHYHLDNLVLTPVNMPHGECKYMAHDQLLLDRLDKTYSDVYAADRLAPLEKKWFYPDNEDDSPRRPAWEWYVAGGAMLLTVIIFIYMVREHKKNQRITAERKGISSRLAEIVETQKARIWIYDVKKNEFSWYNENGTATATYTVDDFAKRYSKEDFAQLKEALERLVTQHKDMRGHEEKEITLELRAKDAEYGDRELHDFVVLLTVLSHDKDGRPLTITGIQKDVTREHHLKQMNNERSLRYWSVFYNDKAGIMIFDKDGYIQNANQKACELLLCDIDNMVKKHIHLNMFFQTDFADLHDADGIRGTKTVGDNSIEYQMKTVYNDKEELLNIFVFCL